MIRKKLLLIALLIVGCEEPKIDGCMYNTACNYNVDATKDDGSCTFAEENYDCDGNCITIIDNCGTCDSDSSNDCVEDACGVWGGNDLNGDGYCQSDLDVLQQFIDNSQTGENPPPPDLPPNELGLQSWENERLVSLCSTNNQNSNCHTDYILSGNIPSKIGNLEKLTLLLLYSNQLSGEIPFEIGNLEHLSYLWLQTNQLSGIIPESICNLNGNWSLEPNANYYVAFNNLCPPYPSCIEDYVGEQDTSNCPSLR